MFTALREELANCTGPNDAVAFVAYHPNCYDDGIMHRSLMTMDKGGGLMVAHHESIHIESKVPLVNNLMVGALGLPADRYDTTKHFEHAKLGARGKIPSQLPIMRSFNESGPPTLMVTRITNKAALKEFIEQNNAFSLSPDGLQALYASDPDERAAEAIAGLRRGKLDIGALATDLGNDGGAPVDQKVWPSGSGRASFTNHSSTHGARRAVRPMGCT